MKMSNHSSRASDGSRPADDTGRRPEVLAGVGLMIEMQRGEARDLFLAGAAHDGDGYDDFVPEEVTKTAPSGNETT